MIRNPVLPGFNPDPSICRVGEDYYIATSTFEWYPGVQIHHSRDLANWTLASRPLNRAALLDMRGNPDSGGIWAPCLSHADGKFWLVYTDVKRLDGAFKDSHNYITCCDTIDGEWCDPWYVNSSGFDPSLFHDDDGRKWFVNMQWNHRGAGTGVNPAHDSFDGILLQEWAPDTGLKGPITNIYAGSPRGLTEAPHIFKRNGWYYLTTAEGGTGYRHAVTLARSRKIEGPYETQPGDHVMCAEAAPDHPIQRTGHGQWVEGPDGTHWHTFLMGRPLEHEGKRYCPMGRETGIARVVWRDDWLYLEDGELIAPDAFDHPAKQRPREAVVRNYFAEISPEFQWLRTPYPDRLFSFEGGELVLTGRESLGSHFEQCLLARRQEDFDYTAEVTIDANPSLYQQAAGLVTYYNSHKFHALMITSVEGKRVLELMSCDGDWPGQSLTFPLSQPVAIPDGPIELQVQVTGALQQFAWRQGAGDWHDIGDKRPAYLISDEGGKGEHASFTGAFVGVCAYDQTGQGWQSRVSRFAYIPEG